MIFTKCQKVLLAQLAVSLLFAKSQLALAAGEGEVKVFSFHPVKSEFTDFYNETGSRAKLENVTELALPSNFTICSAIGPSLDYFSVFFTLLGANQSVPYLSACLYDDIKNDKPDAKSPKGKSDDVKS